MVSNPEITCNIPEGVADMARIVDFSMGDKLTPTDTWCPPYDHGGYYNLPALRGLAAVRPLLSRRWDGLQHGLYAAQHTDSGVGAGAAYVMSGRRTWVSVAVRAGAAGEFHRELSLSFSGTNRSIPTRGWR